MILIGILVWTDSVKIGKLFFFLKKNLLTFGILVYREVYGFYFINVLFYFFVNFSLKTVLNTKRSNIKRDAVFFFLHPLPESYLPRLQEFFRNLLSRLRMLINVLRGRTKKITLTPSQNLPSKTSGVF